MNKITVLFVMLLASGALVAQNTPDEYLRQLPELPDSFCRQTPEAIMEWADHLSPLRDRMQELLAQEKHENKDAVDKGEPNMALFDPSGEAARERYRLTGEKSEALQREVTVSLWEIQSAFTDGKGRVTAKYDEPYGELMREYREALAAGRDISVLKNRIRAMEAERCREMAEVRKEYLTNYRRYLQDNMAKLISINELTDELNRMTYASYTFKTRYGLWMESLLAFTDALILVYDDVPGTGSIMGEL
jgi:hypothetical protein